MGKVGQTNSFIEGELRTGLISSNLLRGELGQALFEVAEGLVEVESVIVTKRSKGLLPVVSVENDEPAVKLTFIRDNYFVEDIEDPDIRHKLFNIAT